MATGVVSLLAACVLGAGLEAAPPIDDAPARVEVLAAARTLHVGLPIQSDDLARVVLPVTALEGRGPVHREATFFSSEAQVVGHLVRDTLLAGEVITDDRLVAVPPQVGLIDVIPRGMRALQVRVAHAEAWRWHLSAPVAVDLFVTHGADAGAVVEPLLEAAVVLAIARESDDGSATVVLHLTPREAERVVQAADTGEISLAVRSNRDTLVLSLPLVTPDGRLVTPPHGPSPSGRTLDELTRVDEVATVDGVAR